MPIRDVEVQFTPLELENTKLGEIVVRSSHSGSGYYCGTFAQEPVLDWHRTGDIAQSIGDNEFMIVGGLDDAISTRCGTIFIPQLEEILMRQTSMRLVVLVKKAVANKDKVVIVAQISSRQPKEKSINSLYKELKKFGLDAQVHMVSSIPQAPSGKPDRSSLLKRYS